jgi:hypothetical protein
MLHDTAELRSLTIVTSDGEVGKADDFYFSDDTWTVRYLIVDAGGWWTGRKVLISPRAVQRLDVDREEIVVNLTREQVKNSPPYDSDKPVSRQYETEHSQYYGYPLYWAGPYAWGAAAYPVPSISPGSEAADVAAEEQRRRAELERARSDAHLRSVNEVSGYAIEAKDGEIGHVESFLIDDRAWSIAAAVVDTRNWWPGKHVVISPARIDAIDWGSHSVRVSLTREQIKSRAEYDPLALAPKERNRRAELVQHALHFGD